MFSTSVGTLFLLLIGALAKTAFAFPAYEKTTKPNIARPRLSELPKDTSYKYKYFDLGRARPQSFDAMVPLDSVACELTADSPLIDDVVEALELFGGSPEGSLCCQESIFDPRCTRLETKDTAVLSLCGGYQRCLYCTDAIDFLLLIFDKCQQGNRVSGRLKLAEISNSPEGGLILISRA